MMHLVFYCVLGMWADEFGFSFERVAEGEKVIILIITIANITIINL